MLTLWRLFLRTALVFVMWQSLFQQSEAARYPDTHALPAGSKVSDSLFVHRQWKVNPKNGLLTILVPVFPTDFELGNLRNQLRTAAQYFDINTVKEYILTAPWEKVSTLQAFVDKEWAVEFPKYHTAARVVSDGQCAPQLNKGTIYDTDRLKYPGWVKQQLVGFMPVAAAICMGTIPACICHQCICTQAAHKRLSAEHVKLCWPMPIHCWMIICLASLCLCFVWSTHVSGFARSAILLE